MEASSWRTTSGLGRMLSAAGRACSLMAAPANSIAEGNVSETAAALIWVRAAKMLSCQRERSLRGCSFIMSTKLRSTMPVSVEPRFSERISVWAPEDSIWNMTCSPRVTAQGARNHTDVTAL